MSRYATTFARLRALQEAALIPYLLVADPTPEVFLGLVDVAVGSGADALELGIAFSDPLADGPTVSQAAQRVLRSGTSVDEALALVGKVRESYPELPIGLLVYANIVMNVPRFTEKCLAAGIDSVLIPDVPIEEDDSRFLRPSAIERIHIVPPNADEALVARVARAGGGYVYVTSRPGVTGAGPHLHDAGRRHLATLREYDSAPPVLGFGISSSEHVSAATKAGFAGAIVGSALIDVVARHLDDVADMRAGAAALLGGLKQATRAQGAALQGARQRV